MCPFPVAKLCSAGHKREFAWFCEKHEICGCFFFSSFLRGDMRGNAEKRKKKNVFETNEPPWTQITCWNAVNWTEIDFQGIFFGVGIFRTLLTLWEMPNILTDCRLTFARYFGQSHVARTHSHFKHHGRRTEPWGMCFQGSRTACMRQDVIRLRLFV